MELDVLTMIGNHRNLVEFLGAYVQDPTNPIIFEELVEGPNLEKFLEVGHSMQISHAHSPTYR